MRRTTVRLVHSHLVSQSIKVMVRSEVTLLSVRYCRSAQYCSTTLVQLSSCTCACTCMCFVGLYESSFCSSHSFDCSIDIGQLVRFTILRSGPHYLVSSRSCSSELSWIPPRMYIWSMSSLIACVRNGYTRQYGFTIASGRAYLQYTKFQILSCLRQVLALSRTCALHH